MSKHSHLRKSLRLKRQSLTAGQQNQAAEALHQHILDDPDFSAATSLAFYQAFDGEIDPSRALQSAISMGKRCFLPVISPDSKNLTFVEYTSDSGLQKNRFGILEPNLYPNNALAAEHMDLLFLPLVGFDRHGTRLGMGAGYYDKHLAFMLQKSSEMTPTSRKLPKLVGLAHECQRVRELERADWDVPMDKIITDQAIYTISA